MFSVIGSLFLADRGKRSNGLSVLNGAEGDMSIVVSEKLPATVALRFSHFALRRLIPCDSCSTQLLRRRMILPIRTRFMLST
jgi:hypothetical protein